MNITGNAIKEMAGDGGGVNCISTNVEFTDCLFEENQTFKTNGNGGAVNVPYVCTVDFINCEFKGNIAYGTGGGVHGDNAAVINVDGCVFDGNQSRRGGAIDAYNRKTINHGVVTISNTYIGNNKAKSFADTASIGGGGICVLGFELKLGANCYIGWLKDENDVLVAAPNIANNEDDPQARGAIWGGGILLAYDNVPSTLTFTDDASVNISNNSALTHGGGIYIDVSTNITEFKDIVINNNTAGENGGGIYVARGNVTVDGVTTNYAYVDEAGKRLDLNSCTIKDNEAKLGGGVYANNTIVTVKSSNGKETLFENNTAAQGGAIYLDDGNTKELTLDAFKISGTTKFISNEANGFVDAENSENNLSGDGGAIYVNGGRGFIVNSVFEKNTAEDNGGAVYINGNNTYGHYGIATVAFGNSDSTLSSTSYNSATNGCVRGWRPSFRCGSRRLLCQPSPRW